MVNLREVRRNGTKQLPYTALEPIYVYFDKELIITFWKGIDGIETAWIKSKSTIG